MSERQPPPLEPHERERVWAWERRMVAFYTGAMLAIALAVLVLWAWGDQRPVRLGIVALIVALTVAGAFVQFRERCPRCGTLLGRQSRFMLPLRCKSCKVEFPRRKDAGQPQR